MSGVCGVFVMIGPASNIWVLTGMAVGMFTVLFVVGLYPV